MDLALSARDVQDILEQRILHGDYPPGSALPPVRELAGELGCSPSTIGRAVQELQRSGWLRVANRRGSTVAHQVPGGVAPKLDMGAALRRLALRSRLSGLNREEFRRLARAAEEDVFAEDRGVLFFLECNPADLSSMSQQVQAATSARVMPLLIDQVEADRSLLSEAVVLTPYFHLADVRPLLTGSARLVPLNFVPAAEVMVRLSSLKEGTKVAVIGANERSRRRLKAIVEQFSSATVRSTSAGQRQAAGQLAAWADVVVTTHAAGLPGKLLRRGPEVITVTFVLDAASVPSIVAVSAGQAPSEALG